MADEREVDDNILRQITENENYMSNHTEKRRKVAYIYSEELIRLCNELPKVPDRASMTHELIAAYSLLPHMTVITPNAAKEEEIKLFHSSDYVDCLRTLSSEEDSEKYADEAELYGLTYDCPAYPGVYEYSTLMTGASVTAARSLMMGIADIAINWTGGWHHAKRDEASGFCYFNDIVVAILRLRQKYDSVLYIDLDLHHGDGVEDAFCATSKVMTVSFHKTAPGFFPGTGMQADVGVGKGRYHAVNVPLKDGIQDDQYVSVFRRVMEAVREVFPAEAIVVQCGADGLAHDPMASFSLTSRALGRCLQYITEWKKPLLLLGGGGYNLPNTARCWTYLTTVALGRKISTDIPEHRWFPKYGPDYDLDIEPGNRPDTNTDEYLDQVVAAAQQNLSNLRR